MPLKDKLRRGWKRLLSLSLGTITGVETDMPAIALTFDDGPDPRYTEKLAGLLEKYNARATFFVVGQSARRYPDIIKRLAEAGHTIANHSWSHQSFLALNSRQRRKQIRMWEKATAPYGCRLFRPPFGHQDFWSRLDAFFMGYRVVTWTILAEDWLDIDAQQILSKIAPKIMPGSIILLHDSLHAYLDKKYTDQSATLEAVEKLLVRFGDQYKFVTLPRLLALGKARKTDWRRRPDPAWMSKLKRADTALLS